jgi:hypothetical protein
MCRKWKRSGWEAGGIGDLRKEIVFAFCLPFLCGSEPYLSQCQNLRHNRWSAIHIIFAEIATNRKSRI